MIEKLEISKLNKDDIEGLIALSSSVGWDYDWHEIETILSSGVIFGHKNPEGQIVSSAAILSYSGEATSIGMVIVHADYRKMGLGRKATQKVIESVSPDLPIMLVATEEGKPLYEKIGFETTAYISKYLSNQFQPMRKKLNGNIRISDYQHEDFVHLLHIDKEAYGVNRKAFLTSRISQSAQCKVVKDANNVITGFAIAVQGPVNLTIGPVIAQSQEDAEALVESLVSKHDGNVRIDITAKNERFKKFLHTIGFENVSNPPVMVLNADKMPQRNGTLFAISAQIFG